jgi:hypothetical protein
MQGRIGFQSLFANGLVSWADFEQTDALPQPE